LSFNLFSPDSLSPGVYTDNVELWVTTDRNGQYELQNCPQFVLVTYTVTEAVPAMTNLSPGSAFAGDRGFPLTVSGAHFNSTSKVLWNGSPRETTCASPNLLNATIAGADIASVATAEVSVLNGSSGFTSASLPFAVQQPVFCVTSLAPASVQAGSPGFTLTVSGALFTSSSQVAWNGHPLPTHPVSSYELSAAVGASDVATAGTAILTVINPADQGGTSNGSAFTIEPAGSMDATCFQINPAHTGAVNFRDPFVPMDSAWTATLDGPPSYPVIANGLVYVTASLFSNRTSELVALSQATGALVWGPIHLDGLSAPAYDSGKVFVAVGTLTGGTVLAFDATLGTLLWKVEIPGPNPLNTAPTVAGGRVYVCGQYDSSDGGGYAGLCFDESSGAFVWGCAFGTGSYSMPAVTASGAYYAFPGLACDLDPASGNATWALYTGGIAGGGGIPVVANGLVYAPNGFGTNDGQVLSTASGAAMGDFVAWVPPAIGIQRGYFLQNDTVLQSGGGTLHAIDLAAGTDEWTFSGDSHLVTSPILVNTCVYVGSSIGNLYCLDAGSGTQLWSTNVGAVIPFGGIWGLLGLPLSGLGAGDGLLVVPAGNTLTAFVLSANP
jgi:outer membrane protein assembly factor BamB